MKKLIVFLNSIFNCKKKNIYKRKPNIYRNNNEWGSAIKFVNFERRQIGGFSRQLPMAGDFYTEKMADGNIWLFEIVKVEYCGNPIDMFFATVSEIGSVT